MEPGNNSQRIVYNNSEKTPLLPNQEKSKKKWKVFGKNEEKVEVNLTPEEKFKDTLEKIKNTIDYMRNTTYVIVDDKPILRLLKSLEESHFEFRDDNLREDFSKNYIFGSPEEKGRLIKSFKACRIDTK